MFCLVGGRSVHSLRKKNKSKKGLFIVLKNRNFSEKVCPPDSKVSVDVCCSLATFIGLNFWESSHIAERFLFLTQYKWASVTVLEKAPVSNKTGSQFDGKLRGTEKKKEEHKWTKIWQKAEVDVAHLTFWNFLALVRQFHPILCRGSLIIVTRRVIKCVTGSAMNGRWYSSFFILQIPWWMVITRGPLWLLVLLRLETALVGVAPVAWCWIWRPILVALIVSLLEVFAILPLATRWIVCGISGRRYV